MKLKFVLSLAMILSTCCIQAQELKIHVDNKGKVGFADKNGNVVIKCQYESAQPFSEGVAIVTKSGKSGIIDATGKVILPLKYSQITSWTKDLYLIKDGKKMGLANHQGNIVLQANYSYISKPNIFNKALIAQGGKSLQNEGKTYMANAKYGIIDNHGSILVTPKYKGLYEFSFDGKNNYPYNEGKRLEYKYHYTVDTLVTDCSYLGFNNNGFSIYNAGIMDGSGKEILKAGLYYLVMYPQGGMVRYYNTKKKKTLCGYHDLSSGKSFQAATFDGEIGNIKIWTHGDFVGDIAPVNGTSWSFIDHTGKSLRTGYTSLKHSLSTGLWAAKTSSGKWDVFDEKNSDVSTLSGYDEIDFPVDKSDKEIFTVKKEWKYGCINRSGETVIPFEYEQALANTFDFVVAKKDGKWGMLSSDNSILIPFEYANMLLPTERNAKHFWVQKSDSLYYHYNLNNSQVASTGYKSVANFVKGVANVIPVDLKIDDTPVNRAQMFAPNTPKETIDKLDMSTTAGKFCYLLNTENVLLIDFPVTALYRDAVLKEIEKRGGRSLSEMEKKSILLDVTRENRSYDLKSTLSENEWNY